MSREKRAGLTESVPLAAEWAECNGDSAYQLRRVAAPKSDDFATHFSPQLQLQAEGESNSKER